MSWTGSEELWKHLHWHVSSPLSMRPRLKLNPENLSAMPSPRFGLQHQYPTGSFSRETWVVWNLVNLGHSEVSRFTSAAAQTHRAKKNDPHRPVGPLGIHSFSNYLYIYYHIILYYIILYHIIFIYTLYTICLDIHIYHNISQGDWNSCHGLLSSACEWHHHRPGAVSVNGQPRQMMPLMPALCSSDVEI